MSAAASLGGCGALAGDRPAVARRGGGARAASREISVRRRRRPWRTGPVATGTLRGRWWAKRRGRPRPLVGKEAVERLIRENGHIFTEAQCKVCSALLISESQRLAHYQSKKHANKVRRYLSIHGGEEGAQGKKMKLEVKQDSKQEGSNGEDRNKCCPICNMTFSSPAVATSHYLGKTHAKNMKQQAPKVEETVPPQKHPAAPPTSTASSNEENKDITDPDKFCSLCHATFNNPLMAKQHYVGKKHRKQETKHKLMAHYGRTPDAPASSFMAGKGYPCSTCNIVLNSIEQYQAHISGFKHKNQMPGAVPVVGPFPPQQYVREESTAPGGYSYFSQDF
uniref:Zinc finger protein 346 n=1 Tax=Ficedula albicollis TaxID=59894 RepID=A0A803VME7_FICAL